MWDADEVVISQSYQGPGRHIVASQLAWQDPWEDNVITILESVRLWKCIFNI